MRPFQNIWGETTIGEGTRIGAFVDIGEATIGKNCSIQSMVTIPPGTIIEDDVFIGPGVHIANDKNPKAHGVWVLLPTIIRRGASIGMGALIGPGLTIGEGAIIGMGAVVTRNVPAGETWAGNPARPQP